MVDLHMHSFYSDDGEFSPAELVEKCAAAGISLMSVTDHNCVRGTAEARECASRRGIRCLSGIEIDCRYSGLDFHLLGYGIDETCPAFAEIEQNVERQSEAASRAMLRATQELGFAVTEAEMYALSAGHYYKNRWTGELFAEALLSRKEYLDHPLLLDYRKGGARGDNPYVNFYWDYYSQGKPGYYEMHYPSLEEVVGIIHRSGGAAVLAHPGVNLKGHEPLLAEIGALGIDGIEVCSSYHTPAIRDFYRLRAQALGLFCTGGSDYHGVIKPAIFLGEIGGAIEEAELCQKSALGKYLA